MVQACRKAVGERQERLYDQSCGHILPQAPPWAPIGHYYSLGRPWRAALRPSPHAPPAPSTWGPTRAPPWPATGLRVLHDEFFELRDFLVIQRLKSSLVALAMLSWCGGGRGGRQRKFEVLNRSLAFRRRETTFFVCYVRENHVSCRNASTTRVGNF